MAKLETFREFHYDATAKVSENTRTLAIAEFAIIWIFMKTESGTVTVPPQLLLPMVLVVVALGFDFLQYVYRSVVWHVIFRRRERLLNKGQITEETSLYVKSSVNLAAYLLFYSKVVVLGVSYYFLGSYLLTAISWK